MRIPSHQFRAIMVGTLMGLFFALSFNAYACLLPVAGVTTAAMGNGCSTPDEQPVRQFCDAFKTIGVQSMIELHPTFDCQALYSEDTVPVALLLGLPMPVSRFVSEHPPNSLPQDLFLKISVLRI